VRVVIEAEADPYGNLLRAPRWSTARLLAEGEEFEPGPHDMVISVPAERAPELTSWPRPWGDPGTYDTYDEWRAREEAKRRHPAGRALRGIFSQSHSWLSPPEPAVPVERPEPVSQGAAVGRYTALEARVAELGGASRRGGGPRHDRGVHAREREAAHGRAVNELHAYPPWGPG
jgi:hypothetical protein